jgi:molybdopterin converting factor small subunit
VTVRVVLPAGLRDLAGIIGEIQVEPKGAVTRASVLDALEQNYPMLRGTLRDRRSLKRRPYVRFFACEQDLSHRPDDELLPGAVAEGAEPLLVVGAIAGG